MLRTPAVLLSAYTNRLTAKNHILRDLVSEFFGFFHFSLEEEDKKDTFLSFKGLIYEELIEFIPTRLLWLH